MWSRKRLDIGWGDLVLAAGRTALPGPARRLATRLEEQWSPSGDALACLSVRSAFDLLLSVLELPAGSEILVSALTIGGMQRIIEAHGLAAVGVDLDLATMAPSEDALRRALSPRTRAVLVAHLFGGRIDLTAVGEFAREHRLLLIEDAAQAYAGVSYTGHALADVSMFSFGPIKTATALGGAMVRVRDAPLLDRMRAYHRRWPMQDRQEFFRRVAKYAALKAISAYPMYAMLVGGCRLAGRDHDRLVNGSVRSFIGRSFFQSIRRRPSQPLLALLEHRLRRFSERRLGDRAAKAEQIMGCWRGTDFFPASACAPHTHWLLPIYSSDPPRLIRLLAANGFDATQGQSLIVVPAPDDRPELDAVVARQALASVVFLPCYAEMPPRAVGRLAAIIDAECSRQAAAGPMPKRVMAAQTITYAF